MATEENTATGGLFDNFNFEDKFEISDSQVGNIGEYTPAKESELINSSLTSETTQSKSADSADDALQKEMKDFMIEVDDNISEDGGAKVEINLDEKNSLSQENGKSDSSSPYKAFAKHLHEEGVLSSLDENVEIEDASSLKDLLDFEVDTRIEGFINSLSGNKRRVVEAALDPDVSEETLLKIISNAEKSVDYMKIDPDKLEDDVDMQRRVLTDFFKIKGFDSKEIEETLDDYDNLGKMASKAKQALESVSKSKEEENKKLIENDRQAKVRAEQVRGQQLQALRSKIDLTKEIIPGIQLNKNMQDKVFQSMTTPVSKTEQGVMLNEVGAARQKDPEGFDMKINYLFQVTKGLTDFSKLVGVAKSQAIKDLDTVIKSNTSYKSGTTPQGKKEQSDLYSSLQAFNQKRV